VAISTRSQPTRRSLLTLAVAVLVASQLVACRSAFKDGEVGVSLILKTLTNPYFVSMRASAEAQAKKDNVKLSVAAGTADGDTQTQINAIDTAIARGDKGILITSNGNAVNAALRQAEDFGLFVIALDTPTIPASTVDITYATDNEQAGKLIGQYAAAKLGGKKAVIAMLDLYNDQVASVDIQRDHGFLEGMGIDPGSKTQNAQESKTGKYKYPGGTGDYQIVCHRPTQGAIDGGRTGMEQCLSANPSINLVYSINEPAGEGAYAALKAAGKTNQAIIMSIDGSCQGIHYVETGELDADAVQYPGKMAALGVSSIAKLARGGKKPTATSGKTFLDTGTALTAKETPDHLKVQSTKDALKRCWGAGLSG
jgi:fructose transport system substrate-binding protein